MMLSPKDQRETGAASLPLRKQAAGAILVLAAFAALGIVVIGGAAFGQTANLRVVTYNIEADVNGGTTPQTGLYTALEAIGQQSAAGVRRPLDILALEETTSNSATVAPIVSALNSYYGAGTYAMNTYQGTQRGGATSGNGPNALIYNTKTVSLVLQNGAQAIGVSGTPSASGGAYRQVIRYKFQPVGFPAAAQFYVYVSHMKSSASGTAAAVQDARNTEAKLIVADIGTLPAGSSALSMGDFNMDGSTEPAYQTLTANGLLVDPLNVPQDNQQTWNVSAYKGIMTQSSTALHYRDDIQFMTANVYNGTSATGLHYVADSCRAFGNNGTTALGASTNSSTNTSLNANFQGPITASAALSALTTGSDHLPVVVDYLVVTPYGTWQSQHFSAAELADSSISGDTASPAGDGISNLAKYAFNLDPKTSGAAGMPTGGMAQSGNTAYLTLTHRANRQASDITFRYQTSADLKTWTDTTPVTLSRVSLDANATDLLTVGVPASGARLCLRLTISKP